MRLKKLFFAAVLIVLAAVPSGCDKTKPKLEGYEIFDRTSNIFKVQYPEHWVYVGEEAEKDMILSRIALYGNAAESITKAVESSDLSGVNIWYDLTVINENFATNVILSVSRQPGLLQRDVVAAENMEQFDKILTVNYPSIYEGYKIIQTPTESKFGGITFLTFKYGMTSSNTDFSSYQAVTADRGYMYTFTLTAFADAFEDYSAIFETMLETVDFTR